MTNLFTSEQLFERAQLDQAELATASLDSVGWRTTGLQRMIGKAATMKRWERETEGLASYAEENGFSAERILQIKYAILADLALANPADRGGQHQNEGARQILLEIKFDLQREAREVYHS